MSSTRAWRAAERGSEGEESERRVSDIDDASSAGTADEEAIGKGRRRRVECATPRRPVSNFP